MLAGSGVADTTSGEFAVNWTTSLTDSHSVSVYAVACENGGTCSVPTRTVRLVYPSADWCAQRSFWEGDVNGVHHRFYFRDDRGRYATNDFVLPGIAGFHNTKVHMYSCWRAQRGEPVHGQGRWNLVHESEWARWPLVDVRYRVCAQRHHRVAVPRYRQHGWASEDRPGTGSHRSGWLRLRLHEGRRVRLADGVVRTGAVAGGHDGHGVRVGARVADMGAVAGDPVRPGQPAGHRVERILRVLHAARDVLPPGRRGQRLPGVAKSAGHRGEHDRSRQRAAHGRSRRRPSERSRCSRMVRNRRPCRSRLAEVSSGV